MSEVAQQYNVMGDILKRGIGGMLEGELESKALDIRASQLGVQSAERERAYHLEVDKFRQQKHVQDENLRMQKDIFEKSRNQRELADLQAKYKVQRWSAPGTLGTLGIDTPWEQQWWNDELGEFFKDNLGWVLNEQSQFVDAKGKIITNGEIWSNPDAMGLIIGLMNPIKQVSHHLKYEQSKLDDLLQNKPAGINDEDYNTLKEQHNKTVADLQAQEKDMKDNPEKYLERQIDSMLQYTIQSPNPEMLTPILQELGHRRDLAVQKKLKAMEAAGRTSDLQKIELYNQKGDLVYRDWISKLEAPTDNPRIKALMMSNNWTLDVPQAIKESREIVKSLAQSVTFSAGVIEAKERGGVAGAAKYIADARNAARATVGLPPYKIDKYNVILNQFNEMGVDIANPTETLDDQLQKITDYANNGGFGAIQNLDDLKEKTKEHVEILKQIHGNR